MAKYKKKKIQIIFSSIFLILIIIVGVGNLLNFEKEKISWGVTFSQKYAEQLELDWRETYLAILDELPIENIRIPIYWDEVEKIPGKYDFVDLDWQIQEAEKKNKNIILTIGRRVPRWPECHDPKWIQDIDENLISERVLIFVKKAIEHFQDYKNIKAWQIENEPMLKIFGKCPAPDEELFKKEIRLARSLDSRSVIVTDSGELSSWFKVSRSGANILGTTMYRLVWNKNFGWFYWPLSPAYYHYKAKFVKWYFDLDEVIISELQGEPWTETEIQNQNLRDQFTGMNLVLLEDNLEFARQAGFDEIYIWGAEWWYWLKEVKDIDDFWNLIKELE